MRYYEDFAIAEEIDLGSRVITSEEIIEFAEEFDPAPFHLSESAGRQSMLGGLAASGWHNCATGLRMIHDAFLKDSASQGSPGVDECRWLAPVLAGSTLSGKATVLEKRLSGSLRGIGFVKFRYAYFTENGKPAFTLSGSTMFACRHEKPNA